MPLTAGPFGICLSCLVCLHECLRFWFSSYHPGAIKSSWQTELIEWMIFQHGCFCPVTSLSPSVAILCFACWKSGSGVAGGPVVADGGSGPAPQPVCPAQSYSLAWHGAPPEVRDCELTCPTCASFSSAWLCRSSEEKAERRQGSPRSGALPCKGEGAPGTGNQALKDTPRTLSWVKRKEKGAAAPGRAWRSQSG